MTEPPRRDLTRAVVPALAAAGLAGLATLVVVGLQAQGGASAPPEGCITDQLTRVGGPIRLVDTAGSPVTEADFAEGPSVVYFGFTHCPSVCPTTMYDLADALREPGGHDIQPVLVTLDPERDTPERMRAYAATEGFPAGLQALTGSPAQIQEAAAAFRVNYGRSEGQLEDGGYNIDHTSFIYVMDQNWRTVGMMSTIGKSSEDIAACIAASLVESR